MQDVGNARMRRHPHKLWVVQKCFVRVRAILVIWFASSWHTYTYSKKWHTVANSMPCACAAYCRRAYAAQHKTRACGLHQTPPVFI